MILCPLPASFYSGCMTIYEKLGDYDDGGLDDLFEQLTHRIGKLRTFSRTRIMNIFHELLFASALFCYTMEDGDELPTQLEVRPYLHDMIQMDEDALLEVCDSETFEDANLEATRAHLETRLKNASLPQKIRDFLEALLDETKKRLDGFL